MSLHNRPIIVDPEQARIIREELNKTPVQKTMERIRKEIETRFQIKFASQLKKRKKLIKKLQTLERDMQKGQKRIFEEVWSKELKRLK